MKTDLYTKIVLTVIAIALVGILVRDVDFVSKVQASPLSSQGLQPKPAEKEIIDVNIVQVKGEDIQSKKLPVYVDGFYYSDPLRVDIAGSTTVPVKVESSVPVRIDGTVKLYQ